MNTTYETLEHNMAKLKVELPAEDFEKALQKAYQKIKGSISIPGFRKGKAPRNIIEKMYGPAVFYDDAAQFAIDGSYDEAARTSGLDIVSRPKFEVEQIGKGKEFIYTAEVAVKPDVTLGSYDEITVTKREAVVTEEDIAEALRKEQEKNSRQVERTDEPAEMGDTVVIDFDGSVDGVPFEGGKSEAYPLTLGSNQFIPGFEDQLVGKKIDEECDVVVTFPEDYHEESLKGKEAVFKCKIHKISHKELPELDDEFASNVSEFDTLEEYKADLEKELLKDKEESVKTQKQNEAVASLVEKSEMDIPDAMIESTVESLANNYAQNMASQGLQIDQYLKYLNMSVDQFLESLRPQAITNIKTRLVLEKVAEVENIEVSDERIEQELKKMADEYGLEFDKVKEMMGSDTDIQMKRDIAVQEAVEFIAGKAKEVEPEPEEKKENESEEKAE